MTESTKLPFATTTDQVRYQVWRSLAGPYYLDLLKMSIWAEMFGDHRWYFTNRPEHRDV